MSDTPRTDKWQAVCIQEHSMVVCARAFERELAALNARIQTIADEAFGPFPVQSSEANLNYIEAGIAKLSRECEDWRAKLDKYEDTNPVYPANFGRSTSNPGVLGRESPSVPSNPLLGSLK